MKPYLITHKMSKITASHIHIIPSIVEFIKLHHIKKKEKEKLITITPQDYIGIAPKLIDMK